MKTKSNKKRVFGVLGVVALLIITTTGGCGDTSSDGASPSLTNPVGAPAVQLVGRVIDGTTRQGIGEATVRVVAGTEIKSVLTSKEDKDPKDGIDQIGQFAIEVNSSDHYQFLVSKDGFALYGKEVSYKQQNGEKIRHIGEFSLSKGIDVTAHVVDDRGTPVKGATIYTAAGEGGGLGLTEISATTDDAGKATLKGLNQLGRYRLVVPALDTTSPADGIYDFLTASLNDFSALTGAKEVTIDLSPARRNVGISVVATNQDDRRISGRYGMADDASIVLVFNYPVVLPADLLQMEAENALVASTDAAFGGPVLHGVTASLSAANTVLTIKPSEKLRVNHNYQVKGTVSAIVNGRTETFSLNRTSSFEGGFSTPLDFYVFDKSPLKAEAITADNYDGVANADGSDNRVFLEFPEFVHGTWQVISTTDGKVVTARTETGSLTRQRGDPLRRKRRG